MNQSARVTETAALRDFRAAMQKFEGDARSGLTMLQLELRRAVEWIEHDRTQYWPSEVRKAFNQIAEARVCLERCELRAPDGARSSCYNEKKALDRAKRRLRLAQEKVETVKHWRNVIRKEAEEFSAQVAKTDFYLESDWARSLAAIERMIVALDRYTESQGPVGESPGARSSTPSVSSETSGNDAEPTENDI